MKKLLKLLAICLVLIATTIKVNAQEIQVIHKGPFIMYKKCGIELMPSQLIQVFKDDPNMKAYYKPMARDFVIAALLKTAATVLIAWPIIQDINKQQNPDWYLAYIGAGCAVLAIPFDISLCKHAKKGVAFYNAGYKAPAAAAVHVDLGLLSNGAGVALNF
jgi:hypothetical protein